jgi:hypothetical protein
MASPIETIRRVRAPGYLVIALMVVAPFIEVFASGWPLQIHQPAWRLSFLGAAGSATLTPLLGIFLLFVAATIAQERGVLLLVSSFCALAATCCVIGAGMFALDALQMRAQVRTDLAVRYDIASGWALAKMGLAGLAFLVLSVSAFRGTRGARGEVGVTARNAKGAPILVRNASGSRPESTDGAPAREVPQVR